MARSAGLTAVWDFSKPFPGGSKWRRPTAEQIERQARTAETARHAVLALQTGGHVPVPGRRPRRDTSRGGPALLTPAETAALRAFLGLHGRDIAGLIARVDGEDGQLSLAHGYRAILTGQPGAHEAWARLVSSLGL